MASPGWKIEDLLDLFLLRKAAYEVGYEAANRPAWLSVPVQGILEIARRVVGQSGRGCTMTDAASTFASRTFIRDLPFGAQFDPRRGTAFRLWAPGEDRVSLAIEDGDTVAMIARAGWHVRGARPLRPRHRLSVPPWIGAVGTGSSVARTTR